MTQKGHLPFDRWPSEITRRIYFVALSTELQSRFSARLVGLKPTTNGLTGNLCFAVCVFWCSELYFKHLPTWSVVLTFLELSKRCALCCWTCFLRSGLKVQPHIISIQAYRLALTAFCFGSPAGLDLWRGKTPTIVPDFIPLIVFRSGRGRQTIISWHYLLYQREGCMQWYVLIFVSFIPSFNLFL